MIFKHSCTLRRLPFHHDPRLVTLTQLHALICVRHAHMKRRLLLNQQLSSYFAPETMFNKYNYGFKWNEFNFTKLYFMNISIRIVAKVPLNMRKYINTSLSSN